MSIDTTTLRLLAPEGLLIVAAALIMVAGAFLRKTSILSFVGLLTFMVAAAFAIAGDRSLLADGVIGENQSLQMSGPMTVDLLGHCLRWLSMVAGLIFFAIALKPRSEVLNGEYIGCLMLVVCGLMITSTAGNLVMLFMGLELVSIPTYVLLFLGRRGERAAESATKYFFLSILSSALLLYGFSFLYGLSGSMQFDQIRQSILSGSADGMTRMAQVALMLIMAGLGFKIAAVPFHFYAPRCVRRYV